MTRIVVVDSNEPRGNKLKSKVEASSLITGFNPENPLKPQLDKLSNDTILLAHERNVSRMDLSRFVKRLDYSGGGNNETILKLKTGDDFTASEWRDFLNDWNTNNKFNLSLLLRSPSKELIEKISPYYLVKGLAKGEDIQKNLFNRLHDWWKNPDKELEVRRNLIRKDKLMSSVVTWLDENDVSKAPPILDLARGYL